METWKVYDDRKNVGFQIQKMLFHDLTVVWSWDKEILTLSLLSTSCPLLTEPLAIFIVQIIIYFHLVSVLLHSCCITLISRSTCSFTDAGNFKWAVVLRQIFRQIVSIRVMTLINTNVVASRHIKREEVLPPVAVRRSKTP